MITMHVDHISMDDTDRDYIKRQTKTYRNARVAIYVTTPGGKTFIMRGHATYDESTGDIDVELDED
jgi:hypothetical protein